MKKVLIASAVALTPFLAFAQGSLSNVRNLIESAGSIISYLIPVAAALALLYFFWGLAQFILAAGRGDEEIKAKAKSIMIWGIVALFVMVSVWGLTGFISRALLGSENVDQTQNIPKLNGVPQP